MKAVESKAGTGSVKKGIIRGFSGSWGSGIGFLLIEDEAGTILRVPCENGQTVRSLEACFGDVIGDGHCVRNDDKAGYMGREIYWIYEDIGILLGGFVSVEEAPESLVEAYESGK